MLEGKDFEELEAQIIDKTYRAYILELIGICAVFIADDNYKGTEAFLLALSALNTKRKREAKKRTHTFVDAHMKAASLRDIEALVMAGHTRAKETAHARRIRRRIAKELALLVEKNINFSTVHAKHAVTELVTKLSQDAATKGHTFSVERIAKDAGRILERVGLYKVEYKSGIKMDADAVLKRHMVTQMNMRAAEICIDNLTENGHDLVKVSSHFGARPTHSIWQGGIYSLSGMSARYQSLEDATGYGSVTGLCGINCKHSFYPYYQGMKEIAQPTRINGHSSEEYYEARQDINRYKRSNFGLDRQIEAYAPFSAKSPEIRHKVAQLKAQKQANYRRIRELKDEYGIGKPQEALELVY